MKPLKNIAQRFWKIQYVQYCLWAGLSALLDIGVFYSLNQVFGLHYLISLSVSFLAGATANFFLNKKLNFKNESKQHAKQFTVYLLITLVGLGFNAVIMSFLIESFKVFPPFARVISLFIVSIYSYLCHKNITFKILR